MSSDGGGGALASESTAAVDLSYVEQHFEPLAISAGVGAVLLLCVAFLIGCRCRARRDIREAKDSIAKSISDLKSAHEQFTDEQEARDAKVTEVMGMLDEIEAQRAAETSTRQELSLIHI